MILMKFSVKQKHSLCHLTSTHQSLGPGIRQLLQMFHRSFKNFSQNSAPLTPLTSPKVSFVWLEAAEEGFTTLKHSFASAPMLYKLNSTRQFIVEVNTSDVGERAVLSQRSADTNQLHPCAFFSHRLWLAKSNYDVDDQELLAVRLALK